MTEPALTLRGFCAALLCALLLAACQRQEATRVPGAAQPEAIVLPLEIFGEGYSETVTFELESADVDTLYLRGNRLSYERQSALPPCERRAKASVRLNGGNWLDISDCTAEVLGPAKRYGGLSGGYHTLELTLPLVGALKGKNMLEFRFNGTDGKTSGYRVLAFNLRKGADGKGVLPNPLFAEDDPAAWQAPLSSAEAISEGKRLWSAPVLLESPLSNKLLRASCADCHAADGRDLKYFNFSNRSITERGKFHGLSELEGKQIASYIRSLDAPHVAQARPWNPPYQPGPGLDARPVYGWAAGAGLEWVLDSDAEMLPHLFPKGISEAALAEVMATGATLNIRETPVALQLPDWNAWLPNVHPLDLWGDTFVTGLSGDATWRPAAAYEEVKAALTADRAGLLNNPEHYLDTLSRLDAEVRGFVAAGRQDSRLGGDPWRSLDGAALEQVLAGRLGVSSETSERERAKLELAKWSAVKQWELQHGFDLEGAAPQLLEGGEARAWVSRGQAVHPLAPHMVADDLEKLEHQSLVVGKYESSIWYQLQMILNPGQRQAVNDLPQDWAYQLRHVRELSRASGVPQPLRYLQSAIKAYQQRDNGAGAGLEGWQLRVTHPVWLYSDAAGDAELLRTLDSYQPGLRNTLVNALLTAWLERTERFESWEVCPPGARGTVRWACVNGPGYQPLAYSSGPVFPENAHSDNLYRLIPCLREQGVDEAAVEGLTAWAQGLWPDNLPDDDDWFGVSARGCPAQAKP